MTNARKFRDLLGAPNLAFLCEVHNGLSARIVEEAGFRGLWGSSLTLSAALGVRDSNEASWTQILEVAEFITDAVSIPMLLDADTGYGNFNTLRRLIRKLEQRQVAAVCIEDKIFPKTNSFLRSQRQPLADVDEFCGKIKAAKDTQRDPDFSVIARVEALVAGWGLAEALRRAEAYHRAGSDGILIHSVQSRPNEVLQFKKEWGNRSPVLIVPTRYYSTPTEVFREAGFRIVIWANMILRSAVRHMRETARRLQQDESLVGIEDGLAPLAELFRLTGEAELEEAEKLYLRGSRPVTHAVILAAAQGSDLGELTRDRPKAMLEISGRPLVYRQVDTLNEIGIKDITIVRGFHKETIEASHLRYVDNDEHATTQEVVSLHRGIQGLNGPALIAYGDILYKKYIPEMLLETEGDFVAAVDSDWASSRNRGRYADYVSCDRPYRRHELEPGAVMTAMGNTLPENAVCGEWIGLLKLSSAGLALIQELLRELSASEGFRRMRMADLFNGLIRQGQRIQVQYIRGHWLDVDDIRDFSAATAF